MKHKVYHWYNHLLSFLLYLLGFGMMGCTPTGDEYGPEPVEYGPPINPKLGMVDSSYVAHSSEIQGSWIGEYEGWDENQKTNAKIRRQLTLNPNGTYTNIVQGVMTGTGKDQFIDFEKETGIYSYKEKQRIITYFVYTDSILDYHNQQFKGYQIKHYYDHVESFYMENVIFSPEYEGHRKWVAEDTYLKSVADKHSNVVYGMDKYDGNKEK